jgi:hypothetical protein
MSDYQDDDFDFGLSRRTVNKKYDFPKPFYNTILQIGQVQTKTKLEQIMDQLGISEQEYVWYNSNQNVKVTIPLELYQDNLSILDQLSFTPKAKSSSVHIKVDKIQKITNVKEAHAESVLKAKYQKILISQEKLYVFNLKT